MVDTHVRIITMADEVTEEDMVEHDFNQSPGYLWLNPKNNPLNDDVLWSSYVPFKKYMCIDEIMLIHTPTACILDVEVADSDGNTISAVFDALTRTVKKSKSKPKALYDEVELSKIGNCAIAISSWSDEHKYGYITLAFKGKSVEIKTRSKKRCTSKFVDELDAFVKKCCEEDRCKQTEQNK